MLIEQALINEIKNLSFKKTLNKNEIYIYICKNFVYFFRSQNFVQQNHDQDIYRFSTTKFLPLYNMKLKLMIVMFRFDLLQWQNSFLVKIIVYILCCLFSLQIQVMN